MLAYVQMTHRDLAGHRPVDYRKCQGFLIFIFKIANIAPERIKKSRFFSHKKISVKALPSNCIQMELNYEKKEFQYLPM